MRTHLITLKALAPALFLALFVSGCGGNQAIKSSDSSQVDLLVGADVFAASCAVCHGDNGEGNGFPFVIGEGALDRYSSESDLRDYISSEMPEGNAGSLSEAEYAAVSSWLWKQNKPYR